MEILFDRPTFLFLSSDGTQTQEATAALEQAGYRVEIATDIPAALACLARTPIDLAITPLFLPDLEALWSRQPALSILLLAEPEQLDLTIELLQNHRALDALIAPWTPEQLILRVTHTRALAIEVARRDAQLIRSEQGSMRSLIEVLEAKDPNTMHHSRRVATLAEALAKTIKPGDAVFQERVRVAAQFHDIGKVGVPDTILRKTGKLMEVEWEFVRSYVDLGVTILRHTLDAETVAMVQTHAEHFDGNGYPIGLKAQKIPLGGRIIAVADAYDAMTSPRAYREAFTREKANEVLREGSGKQWDPKVVAAFLAERTPLRKAA
jgi:putative nucleotidyltransferase with HDIG domain